MSAPKKIEVKIINAEYLALQIAGLSADGRVPVMVHLDELPELILDLSMAGQRMTAASLRRGEKP